MLLLPSGVIVRFSNTFRYFGFEYFYLENIALGSVISLWLATWGQIPYFYYGRRINLALKNNILFLSCSPPQKLLKKHFYNFMRKITDKKGDEKGMKEGGLKEMEWG